MHRVATPRPARQSGPNALLHQVRHRHAVHLGHVAHIHRHPLLARRGREGNAHGQRRLVGRGLDGLRQRLAVADAHMSEARLHPKLGREAVVRDIEMQLAHATQHGLGAVRDMQTRIRAHEHLQRVLDGALLRLGSRLNTCAEHRRRDMHAAQPQRAPGRAADERVACACIAQAQHDANLAGMQRAHIDILVRVRQQKARQALLVPARRVDHALRCMQRARIHFHKRDRTASSVPHDLEGERRRRRIAERHIHLSGPRCVGL